MIVQCPECNTKFKFPDERMKPEGVKVRCSKCKHVFRAEAPLPATPHPEAQPPAPAPEREPAPAGVPTLAVEPKPAPAKQPSTHDELFAGFAAVAPESLDSHAGQAAATGFDLDFGKDDGLGLDLGAGQPAASSGKQDDFDFGGDFGKDSDLGLDFGAGQPAALSGKQDDFDFGGDFGKDSDLGLDFDAGQPAASSGTEDDFGFGVGFDDLDAKPGAVFDGLGLDAEFGGKGDDALGLGDFDEKSAGSIDSLGFDTEFGTGEQVRPDSRAKDDLGFDVDFGGDDDLGFDDIDDVPGDALGRDDLFGASADKPDTDFENLQSGFGAKGGSSDEDYLEDEFFKDFDAKHGSDTMAATGGATGFAGEALAEDELGGGFDADSGATTRPREAGLAEAEPDTRVERDNEPFAYTEDVAAGPISLNLDEPMKDKRKESRGGKGKSLAVALVLLLLVAGTAGAVWYLGLWQMIPGLPDLFTATSEAPRVETPAPAVSSAEAVKHIALENVRQYTVPNDKIGTVFVIEGRAVNNFQEPKELIKVEGVLFDQSGKSLESKSLMAGNTLSLFQLQVMSKTEIEAQLASEVGILSNNTNLASGGSTPFMVVFFNPPDTVKEFQIKIVEAKNPPKQ